MTTTINVYEIVSVRVNKRSLAEGVTWRHIIITDANGRETRIVLFPDDYDSPEQISIIDEERQP